MKESTSNKTIINMMGAESGDIVSENPTSSAPFTIEENNIANPITIIPWSNKMSDIPKFVQDQSKTTIDNCMIRKKSWKKSQALTENDMTALNLDDDLGNILDIPIIFAKDDESLNAIDKLPSVPLSIAGTSGINDQSVTTKANPATRVVLLSNKDDKVHRALTKITSKVHEPGSLQSITSSENTNHQVILQTRMQNSPSISTVDWSGGPLRNISRPANQPTIKYTKIILSKRNLGSSTNSGEQVILTKHTRKIPNSQVLTTSTNQQRYRQLPIKVASTTQVRNTQKNFQTDQRIKTKTVESKLTNISETDAIVSDKDQVHVSSPKILMNLNLPIKDDTL